MNGINNLLNCARSLNLKSQVISSASIYYHKFYFNLNKTEQKLKESIKIDDNLIAITCLYLASKVEENSIKCKDLLIAFNECLKKDSCDLNFEKYNQLKESIFEFELLICQLLNFELNNQLPHNYLLHYLKSINEWLFNDKKESIQFSNFCWSLLGDFYRTDGCINSEFKPQEISIAIIQISIRVFKDKLDDNLDNILEYTNKLYDNLNANNLWKINLILMKSVSV